jgi:23S rRNA pseudouridine2605 synthase
LTNDGGLARVLELPATGWLRRYRVRAHGEVAQETLNPLSEGVTIDGVDYAGIEAVLDRAQGANVWMTMGLREGKNREIKKVLEHLGLAVNRLIRISFGPFQLGELEEGAVAEVRTRVLRDQLGAKLAREAGVDFDSALSERGAPEPAPRAESRERRPPQRADRKPRAGGFEEREERAKSDPKTSYAPKMRKHVSTLRAEKSADGDSGPRRRIERGATADRKGREVKVERLLPTAEEARRRALAAARAKERSAAAGRSTGRTFRHGDRTKPAYERSRSDRAPTGDAPFRERPPRDDTRPRRQGADARPARRDDATRPGRDSDRPSRPAKPFRKGPPRDSAGGGNRRGDEPRSEAKPFRESATGRGPRPHDDGKPFRKGPGAGRPRGGAPSRDGGKPFRKGSPRDRSGGKPRGGGSRPPRGG